MVTPMLVAATVAGCRITRTGVPRGSDSTRTTAAGARLLAVRYDQHLFAGGLAPLGDTMLHNPFAGKPKLADEGQQLFKWMNCDGCHGGGEGWVGPSLSDGRWSYGGNDAAVFQTIYYGRSHGMPAFGGMLSPDAIWRIVTYIRSLPLPKAVPTQAW